MPVAIALIAGVLVLAIALIGLVWAIIFLLPFYAYVALAVYLVRRSNRAQADLSASVEREAARQRRFNEQEMRAWNSSIEHDSRAASGRKKVVRRFDNERDPAARNR
ncbi:hypothetical protein [Bradyrhizobium sp. JYMT SZCCT0428]|uniref:hypothetical protein n=1 Tax=Bradyrhizobium sp. JYMT SZCCT0428 TaxID=2807673 RepID=UPI001BADB432|nr:hypothetical protein [Bradyrhizobium sp. JYMT SZCCT0428]MBR1154607.1 hypothetical protein [Bradyrhizobium sp. JYMT SZCCT0428]